MYLIVNTHFVLRLLLSNDKFYTISGEYLECQIKYYYYYYYYYYLGVWLHNFMRMLYTKSAMIK